MEINGKPKETSGESMGNQCEMSAKSMTINGKPKGFNGKPIGFQKIKVVVSSYCSIFTTIWS